MAAAREIAMNEDIKQENVILAELRDCDEMMVKMKGIDQYKGERK